jgi:hypothetical protein
MYLELSVGVRQVFACRSKSLLAPRKSGARSRVSFEKSIVLFAEGDACILLRRTHDGVISFLPVSLLTRTLFMEERIGRDSFVRSISSPMSEPLDEAMLKSRLR